MNVMELLSFRYPTWLFLITIGWMLLVQVSCSDHDEDSYITSYNQTVQKRERTFTKKESTPHKLTTAADTTRKSTFSEMIKENFLIRRKRALVQRQSTTDPLVQACQNVRPSNANPLRCYRCESNTKRDKEPVCDHRLWKYLKHSEQTRLRETCDLEGVFCAKIVQQKLGQRLTTRGCYGKSVIGPNRTLIKSRTGCAMFNQNGYRTTFCLCDTDFCNSAYKSSNPGRNSLIFITMTILCYFYAV